jgi:hypothetical protein
MEPQHVDPEQAVQIHMGNIISNLTVNSFPFKKLNSIQF